jgi:hypothetical protein
MHNRGNFIVGTRQVLGDTRKASEANSQLAAERLCSVRILPSPLEESQMDENNSVYFERDDGWATPCCGIGMWGDIIENETLCPYCEKTFEFEDDEASDVQSDTSKETE